MEWNLGEECLYGRKAKADYLRKDDVLRKELEGKIEPIDMLTGSEADEIANVDDQEVENSSDILLEAVILNALGISIPAEGLSRGADFCVAANAVADNGA